jgi:hypothetical protein
MAVWFMRWPQCLLCDEFTLFDAEIASGAGRLEYQQMIVETTCCARENARVR